MRRLAIMTAAAAGTLMAISLSVASAAPSPLAPRVPPICNPCDESATGTALADRVLIAAQRTSDKVPRGTPETHGDAPGRTNWIELDEYMAPTCPGNRLRGSSELCNGALLTCPEGLIRYWIWQRETQVRRDPATGAVAREPGGWQQLPDSFCLGSDDPGVPDYGRAISLVQQGFRDLPLPKAAVEVAPSPTSLVNVATAFFAGGEQTFSQTVEPVPGISVVVTAKPTRWTWTWGDGKTGTFDTAGVPRRPVVSHLYPAARDYEARVVVSWTGRFRIAGSTQEYEIPTPASVPSPPVTVQVREARTQLVAG